MLVDEQDIKLNNVNTSSITHCCMLVNVCMNEKSRVTKSRAHSLPRDECSNIFPVMCLFK